MKFTFEQDTEETKAMEEASTERLKGFFSMVENAIEKVAVPLVSLASRNKSVEEIHVLNEIHRTNNEATKELKRMIKEANSSLRSLANDLDKLDAETKKSAEKRKLELEEIRAELKAAKQAKRKGE